MNLETEYPIRTEKLSKKYIKSKFALNEVDIRIKNGKITGFLGVNGAGKTTTIKLLLGLLEPTSGKAYIFDEEVKSEKAWLKKYIGYLPEFPRFPGFLTPVELLKIYGEFYGMEKGELTNRVRELLNLVELSDVGNKKIKTFSKGMMQRVGLASALLNSPPLYILDEPTSGLDLLGQQLVKNIIRDQNLQGKTVFMSSHLLKEVQEMCSDIILLHEGKVLWSGEIKELLSSNINTNVRLNVDRTDETVKLIKDLSFIKSFTVNGNIIDMVVESQDNIPEISTILVKNNIKIYEIKMETLNIENAVLNLLKGDESE
ncbi:MAG: ABC transporter ATP-binding protein [Thermoplasmata archaeon]